MRMRTIWPALLLLPTCLHAATVRGRLQQSVGGRVIPAGGVSVTLMDRSGRRTFAVTSDAGGMYYFQNVAEGPYTLQIWRRPGAPPIPYPIVVKGPLLDVNPLNLP